MTVPDMEMCIARSGQRCAATIAQVVVDIDGTMKLKRLMRTVAHRMGDVDREMDIDFEKLANRDGEITARQEVERYFLRILRWEREGRAYNLRKGSIVREIRIESMIEESGPQIVDEITENSAAVGS